MCKRGMIHWAMWLAVFCSIFCMIYAKTIGDYTAANVLPKWNVVFAAFTSLSLYFIVGAKREQFWTFICSTILGVFWGMLYMIFMDYLESMGLPWVVTFGTVVVILVFVECTIHFSLPASWPINEVPAQFISVANVFWCSCLTKAVLGVPSESALSGFYNFTAMPVLTVTLCYGIVMALVCGEGLRFIDPETGDWKWPSSDKKEVAAE